MTTISMPVKGYVKMNGPYADPTSPQKVRFYCNTKDVPAELLEWMSTNPREQNLGSSVAKTIAASLREDHKEFHLRNRGLLLSALDVVFTGDSALGDGTVSIVFEDHGLHGDIDGGHTLRIILAAQDDPDLPEQYVEFEVITGLATAVDIAEARNTSVALDIRTMEEMKGSYAVLKETFEGVEINGDLFFDRVELKMNQQLEESNHIDIRMVISILLMFNQDLYPVSTDTITLTAHPKQMYGGKEAALKKYLELGDGDTAVRDAMLRKMSPVFVDIIKLWDIVERELPMVKERQYKSLRLATQKKTPRSTFSNIELPYTIPQSIVFPVIAAFRSLIAVDENGKYGWRMDPFSLWEATKTSLTNTVLDELKSFKGNPNVIVKNNNLWSNLYGTILLEESRARFSEL